MAVTMGERDVKTDVKEKSRLVVDLLRWLMADIVINWMVQTRQVSVLRHGRGGHC